MSVSLWILPILILCTTNQTIDFSNPACGSERKTSLNHLHDELQFKFIREKKSTSKFILSFEKRNGKCVSSHHNHSVFTTACVLRVLYFMEKLVLIYFLIGFSLRFTSFYNCARRRRQSQFLNASNTIRTVWRRLSDRSIKRFKCPRSERWFWTNKLH